MNDKTNDAAAAKGAAPTPAGDRIAKVLARAGVASRREAERMIELGQVSVNGKVIDSPALNVTARDRITVDGKPLQQAEPARLWLYYKPEGLVTSERDEKGRQTVFESLPEDMPRVMSVGRLDLNSEGLLLLTNDGDIKRRLELPSTGWLRKYRVRVKGNPDDTVLDPLRRGIVIDGERFQPMTVTLDRLQGANAWLTVGLREGKNREIRRAMDAIGMVVNRLIRVSYGPFRLGDLQPGEVEEIKARVLRDQLGMTGEDSDGDVPKPRPKVGRNRPAAGKAGPQPAEARPQPPASTKGWAKAGRPATAGARTGGKPGPRPDAKSGGPRSDGPPARGPRPGGPKPSGARKPADRK